MLKSFSPQPQPRMYFTFISDSLIITQLNSVWMLTLYVCVNVWCLALGQEQTIGDILQRRRQLS